jgi:putative PEP-CTERM system histidine kinase
VGILNRGLGSPMFQAGIALLGIIAAVLFALYLAILSRRLPHSRQLALMLLVCAALELFDLLAVYDPQAIMTWKRAALFCEGLLPLVWLLLSLAMCGQLKWSGLSRLARLYLLVSPAFLLVVLRFPPGEFFFGPDFPDELMLFLSNAGYIFYLGIVAYLIYALVLLEHALAGLARRDRWKMKFEVIGVGAILAVQFFYYSHGLLYRSLDMRLVPARALALLLGTVLMAYSRLRRGVPRRFGVSRTTAYHSVALLAVGVYLFGLGLAGEGMRYLGADSQRYFLIVLGLFGAVGLLTLILSDALRRKTRVFIHRHFFKEKYDYRRHWLEFTNRMSQCRNPVDGAGTILEFFCDTFSVRGSVLYLRSGEDSDFFPVAVHDRAFPAEIIPGRGILATYVGTRNWVFDCRQGPTDAIDENRELLDREEIHFVVPLHINNRLEGLVLLGSPIDQGEIFFIEDYNLMKALAAQAAEALHNQRLVEQLAAARELAAIGKVAAFVMHDLKNAVSNLALVLENARNHLNDPEFQQDMIVTLDNSVGRMKGLIDRLKNFETKGDLDLRSCDLLALAEKTLATLPGSGITLKGEPVAGLVDQAEISKVILNLALNALEASDKGSPIIIEVGVKGSAFIRCRDQGCGMPEPFISERLFRPFETTKRKGFGIGLYQCRQIVEAHGGKIEVKSEAGLGTEFTVWLPLAC